MAQIVYFHHFTQFTIKGGLYIFTDVLSDALFPIGTFCQTSLSLLSACVANWPTDLSEMLDQLFLYVCRPVFFKVF